MHGLNSIPLGKIIPSDTNPRRMFEHRALAELADSLRAVGMLQPVVVRPLNGRFTIEPGKNGETEGWFLIDRRRLMPAKGYSGTPAFYPTQEAAEQARPEYELVAGERRWRAAALADFDGVPAIVRDLDDVQAAELQITENLQRQDITPLEEAEGFRRLIDLGAYTPDTLAEKLGKSRAHVYARLRLLKLGPAVRNALGEGRIEASVAELLSKFETEELQVEALDELMESVSQWAADDELPIPFRRAKRILEDFYPDLKEAPWKMDVASLPGGACADCPKRVGNMPDPPDGANGRLTCTDRHCYKQRLWVFRNMQLDRLVADQVPTLTTLDEHTGVFTSYGSAREEPSHESGFVLSKSLCSEAKGKAKTWHQVVAGLEVKELTLVTPSGRVVQVFRKKDAMKAALEAGRIEKTMVSGASVQDRAEKIEENKRRRAITAAIAQAVLDQAAQVPVEQLLAKFIHHHQWSWGARKYLKSHIGAGVDMDQALAPLRLRQLQGLLVALLVAGGQEEWCDYSARQWAKHLGLDVDAIAQNAEKAFEAHKAKPAKKGAKR